MPYTVTKFDQNARRVDGTSIVLHDCGHKHRILSTALRCRDALMGNGTTYPAMWYGCVIAHSDGSALTPAETDDLNYQRWLAR